MFIRNSILPARPFMLLDPLPKESKKDRLKPDLTRIPILIIDRTQKEIYDNLSNFLFFRGSRALMLGIFLGVLIRV